MQHFWMFYDLVSTSGLEITMLPTTGSMKTYFSPQLTAEEQNWHVINQADLLDILDS